MSGLMREVALTFRRLVKNPGSSGLIILTLSVCLGAATGLFSVVESVLLDPWPYRGFDRITVFRGHQTAMGGATRYQWSAPEIREMAGLDEVFDEVIAGRARPVNLTAGDRPERVHAVEMSADVFPMLGVNPKIGRAFTAHEDRAGSEQVVVMSHGLWERRFGSDPDLVGETLSIEGSRHTVIGIMPDRFRWWGADLWFPLRLNPAALDRTDRNLTVQARVKEGVSLEQAQSELNALARRWESEYGATMPEYNGLTFGLRFLSHGVLGEVRPALYALLGFVALLLLIGCINVANLMMARAIDRRKEVAIHIAMGCRPRRVMGRFLLESLVLAVTAAALGILIATWSIQLIVGLIPPIYIPAEAHIDIDKWTVVFACLTSIFMAGLCGLLPAVHAMRTAQTGLVLEGGTRTTAGRKVGRVRAALVVSQVTLATVLLVASGLMIRSIHELSRVDPGFDRENVLTLDISLSRDRYSEPHEVVDFFQRLSERISSQPGVESVGTTSSLPLEGPVPTSRLTIEGRGEVDVGAIPSAGYRTVSPGYFRTLDIPLLQGRVFGREDTADSQSVAVINQTMAERFWGKGNPLGGRFKVGPPNSAEPWMTVAGIAEDVRNESLETSVGPIFYMPHSQRADSVRSMTLVVGSSLPPEELVKLVRRAVERLDPEQPVHGIETLSTIWTDSMGAKPLALALLSMFASIGLLLAVVGIFAMMAFSVSRRTGEIGIRMALGADRSEVVHSFLRQGLVLTIAGVLVGLLAALAINQAISRFTYGVAAFDPLTFSVTASVFVLAGVLGSYFPARRAARINPIEALRHE